MFKIRFLAFVVIILAIVLGFVGSLLPLPPQLTPDEASTLRASIAFLTFLQVITLGITGIFLLGLKGFKTEFRQAYYLICLGQVIGIATAVAVYAGVYISSYTQPEVEVIGTIIGFIIAIISAGYIMAGTRYFARLLRVRSWALSPRIIIPTIAIVMITLWLPPHVPVAVSELLFRLQIMPMVAYGLLTIFLGIATIQIRQVTGIRYHRALAWFATYEFLIGVSVLTSVLLGFTGFTPESQQVIFLLHIISTLVLVNAGISFNKITRQSEAFKLNNKSAIDLITYMASYASHPQEIDPILDNLRAITAKDSDNNYSVSDMQKLTHIYRELEDYLVTKEPLRTFTKDNLRALLRERFSESLVSMFTKGS